MPWTNGEPPLYGIWKAMKQRCDNPRVSQFQDYGGRNITYCDAWKSYKQFEQDMGAKPSPQHTIERIDNDKGYSPENCRWATRKEQSRNRRQGLREVIIEGKSYAVVDLIEKSGLRHEVIIDRASKGLSYDEVIDPKSLRGKQGTWMAAIIAHQDKAQSKTHCSRGHPLNADNLYVTPQGWRHCRACRRKP